MVGADDKVEFVDFFLLVVVVAMTTTATTTTASVGLPFCANVSTCLPPREREMRDIWTNNESASKNDVANVQQPIDREKGGGQKCMGKTAHQISPQYVSYVGDLRQGDWHGVLKGPPKLLQANDLLQTTPSKLLAHHYFSMPSSRRKNVYPGVTGL